MPRKIDLNTQVETVVKPKREITDAQREHLNKIRLLAMAKKSELKEITLKSKLPKTLPKQELAKQYDEYIAQKAVTTHKPAVKPKPEPEPESEEEEEQIFDNEDGSITQIHKGKKVVESIKILNFEDYFKK